MRTGALRWTLLLVLALGVLLMHHVPTQHVPTQHAPAHHVSAQPVPAQHDSHQVQRSVSAHAQVDSSDTAPDGHGVLHLCLALAVTFLALLAPRLGRAVGAPVEVSLPRLRRTLERARPPDPLPRRLAALCVLRR